VSQFDGAVIREQGVTLAVVIVRPSTLQSTIEAGKAIQSFQPVFAGLPIVLMAQDGRGPPDLLRPARPLPFHGQCPCARRPVALHRQLEGAPMADVQVTCINKQPRDNPHEGITHLGGSGWKWTRQQVVDSINKKTNTFYTRVNGKRADVGVVHGPNGDYVRTYADRVWNDNLLALPECA
jgi:hypothetical protein